MDMPEDMTIFKALKSETVLGRYEWNENLNILNICLIGLAEKLSTEKWRNPLHRLLGVLFTNDLKVEEKLDILENEYGMSKNEFRKDMTVMCNLAERIEEKGIEKGIEKGELRKAREITISLDKMGLSADKIAQAVKVSTDTVRQWLSERKQKA